MKQSKKIPRRVAGSLIYSLNCIADRLNTAIEYVNSPHTYIPDELNARNAKYIVAGDKQISDSIREFWRSLSKKANRGGITSDAFITIAKHKDLRVRYVTADASTGLVITTGCLKRILELSANVVDQVESGSHRRNSTVIPVPMYLCDNNRRYTGRPNATPHFLRILDIIRYMDETGMDMLEVSLEGIDKDIKTLTNLGGYGYGASVEHKLQRMYPFMSDRYQDESWNHYLTTLYSDIVKGNVNDVFPVCTPVNRDIALSELNLI